MKCQTVQWGLQLVVEENLLVLTRFNGDNGSVTHTHTHTHTQSWGVEF